MKIILHKYILLWNDDKCYLFTMIVTVQMNSMIAMFDIIVFVVDYYMNCNMDCNKKCMDCVDCMSYANDINCVDCASYVNDMDDTDDTDDMDDMDDLIIEMN
jgi:hypothetical protein